MKKIVSQQQTAAVGDEGRDLLDWLMQLFAERMTPERIETRVVQQTKLGPLVKQFMFDLEGASPTRSTRKPSKSEIEAMAVEIIKACRRDCNALKAENVYGVFAVRFDRDNEHYGRHLMRFSPAPVSEAV